MDSHHEKSGETRTPFQIAAADFIGTFGSEDLSDSRIQAGVAPLLDVAMPHPTVESRAFQQKLIDNWTGRSVIIADGTVMERIDKADAQARKIQLLCDVTAYVTASHDSSLPDTDKTQLIALALNKLETFAGVDAGMAREHLGNALAAHMQATIERAEREGSKDQLMGLGRFTLGQLRDHGMLSGSRRRSLKSQFNKLG